MISSLQYSLEKSSRTIEAMTQRALAELREKQFTPSTSFKAEIWLPKAERAYSHKNKLIAEIDRIANACNDNGGTCKKADLTKLGNRLNEFKDSSLNIDPLINAEFARNFSDSADNARGFTGMWTSLNDANHFSEKERAALFAQLRLLAIQNSNEIVRYCNEQVSETGFYFTVYSAIVAQNTNALYPGEPLEITAGVGLFSRRAQPKVLIDGKPSHLGEDATFKYFIQPKGKPGIYKVPVVLDFVDEEGRPQKITKNITYRLLPAPTDK